MPHSDLPITLQRVGYREKGTRYHYAAHQLDMFQWYCVLYGSVDMIIELEHHVLRAEESILIPPGATRSPRSLGSAPGYLWAHFSTTRLDLSSVTGRILPTPMELQQSLRDLVSEIQHPADANADDLIGILLTRILISLRRGVAGHRGDGASRTPSVNATYQHEIVERVESYIRNNLNQPLTRAHLASVVSLSPAHLARVYRQVRQKTLNQALTEIRVDYSKKLLLESTLSITQVSLSVGYRSFSHFSSMFREHVGVTPSDYRQSGGRTWRKSFG
jgi:AraC-like DNA-binding protein